jgi:integrase
MNEILPTADYSLLIDQVFDGLDVRNSTIYEYKIRIKHFLSFIATTGMSLNTFLDYKRELMANAEYGTATKNKYLTCARIFLRECHRLGLLPRDITTNVKGFRQSSQHKLSGLSETDVYLICQWVKAHPDKLREHALLSLLLFQGLRQAEICQISRGDVNLDDQTFFILGKGRDDKEKVYLHPETGRALKKYIDSKPFEDTSYLFTAQKLTSGTVVKLTERGLRYIVKSIFGEVGIDKNVHGFRHYFTTKLIKSMPGQLTTVAQFTRHRSLSMLQVYNDSILQENDLPTFYATFDDVAWPQTGYHSLQYASYSE